MNHQIRPTNRLPHRRCTATRPALDADRPARRGRGHLKLAPGCIITITLPDGTHLTDRAP